MTDSQKLDKILEMLEHQGNAILALDSAVKQDRARLFTAHDELGGRVTRLERVIKPKPVRARKAASRG
jgi:hypothetical protein